ncbi:MAG: ABC transporter permease [Thermoplasmata archaeon]
MKGARLLKHTGWIAWKDLLDLTRNRIGLVMIVLMPMFMMIMTGYIFPSNTGISHQPIGIVNNDAGLGNNTMPSTMFIAALYKIGDSTGMMDLSNATTIDELKGQITNGKLSGGIIIDVNFTASVLSGKQGNVTVIADESNPQMYAMIQAALSQVISQMGTMVAQSQLNNTIVTSAYNNITINKTVNENNSLAVIKPYNVTLSGVTTSGSNYFEFVAPGIMMMTVMMSLMTGLPHAISHEKEAGTLDGMLTAPVNRLAIILGKSLSQTIRGLVQGILILILAVALFGVVIYGNILLVLCLLLLGVFSFVGLGIVITCYAKDEETAGMIMMTLMFPMMFLSGIFFPTQQMPWFMQSISNILPLTYAAGAMRKVIVLGAGISAISFELTVLIGFGAVMLAIAVPMFKKAMTR